MQKVKRTRLQCFSQKPSFSNSVHSVERSFRTMRPSYIFDVLFFYPGRRLAITSTATSLVQRFVYAYAYAQTTVPVQKQQTKNALLKEASNDRIPH